MAKLTDREANFWHWYTDSQDEDEKMAKLRAVVGCDLQHMPPICAAGMVGQLLGAVMFTRPRDYGFTNDDLIDIVEENAYTFLDWALEVEGAAVSAGYSLSGWVRVAKKIDDLAYERLIEQNKRKKSTRMQ